ncbi:MAG: CmpA/NrtA family ABC transporter substrate-binding protein [Oceanococcus sp.]
MKAKAMRVGYVPLTDALPLFVAHRLGYYADHGISVDLVEMHSWAQMRDALIYGQIDAGHCLPGIPLASQAGLFGEQTRLACALTLNHFGNAITLSNSLCDALNSQKDLGRALQQISAQRRSDERKLTFGSVFPLSKHEFELRHWLRSCQLNPDVDVSLVVVPPPLVARALQAGTIDGFCVGEPWSSLAVSQGLGEVIVTSRKLALPGTEKVLAAPAEKLQSTEHRALMLSLIAACEWLENIQNRCKASLWLGEEIGLDNDLLAPGLFASADSADDRHIQFSGINRPDRCHARWLIEQIEKNVQGAQFADPEKIIQKAFRSDIYDRLTAALA